MIYILKTFVSIHDFNSNHKAISMELSHWNQFSFLDLNIEKFSFTFHREYIISLQIQEIQLGYYLAISIVYSTLGSSLYSVIRIDSTMLLI